MENVFQFVYEIIYPQNMWERKVKEEPRILRDVPDKYVTQEMCEKAVFKNPAMLKYVPDKYITQEMCLNALKCDINLFEEVLERFSEDSKCKELGRCKGGNGGCEVLYFDNGSRTQEIVTGVIKWFVENTAMHAGGAITLQKIQIFFVAMIVVMRLQLICAIVTRIL